MQSGTDHEEGKDASHSVEECFDPGTRTFDVNGETIGGFCDVAAGSHGDHSYMSIPKAHELTTQTSRLKAVSENRKLADWQTGS
jgi:hypothetical protein